MNDIKIYEDHNKDHNKDKPLRLNWTIREYIGHEIAKSEDGPRLTSIADISLGDDILASWPSCWRRMKVTRLDGDEGWAEDEWLGVTLQFGRDDRKCWVACCWINLEALKKIKIEGAHDADMGKK